MDLANFAIGYADFPLMVNGIMELPLRASSFEGNSSGIIELAILVVSEESFL